MAKCKTRRLDTQTYCYNVERRWHLERRSWNGLLGEFDADVVLAGFGRDVFYGAGSVAVVLASHLGF